MNEQDFFRKSIDLINRASTVSDAQIIVEGIISLLEKHPHDVDPAPSGTDPNLIGQVADIIKQLGGEVDEVGQYLLAATGANSLDDITQDDLEQLIGRAYGPAAQAAKQASGQLSPDQIRQGIDIGRSFPGAVASAADPLKGEHGARLPGGGQTDIDVDVSGADVTAGISAFDKLSKIFPRARERFNRGDFSGALNQIFNRMDPIEPKPEPKPEPPRSFPGRKRFI